LDSLTFFLDITSRGIALGAAYALMGLGLTLIFGIMRIVNFAQGEFYMLGTYTVFALVMYAGIPFYLGIPLGMLLMFILGMAVEKTLLSPISKGKIENPMEYSLIITIGLSIFIRQLVVIIFGPNYQKMPDFISGKMNFGFLTMTWSWFLALVVSALLIIAVTLYIRYSWRGRSWRSISETPDGASILGVNVKRERSIVFGLSCLLAAGAGAVLAPITLIYPTVGSAPLIKGYEILAIGGLGSIPGSLVGGIMLGLAETYGSVYINSAYKDFYGFALLMLFLIFRPRGLFGKN
jgi:branched-chain amino acid transport system permease protein